jgi:hypothetical protein
MLPIDRFIAVTESIHTQGAHLGRPALTIRSNDRPVPVQTSIGDTIRALHQAHPNRLLEVGLVGAQRITVLSLSSGEMLESGWDRDAGAASAGGMTVPDGDPDEIAKEVLRRLHG